MLIRYPRRVTVNNKRLLSKGKKSEKKVHIYKSHGIIKNNKENYSNSIGPQLLGFIISICLEDRNVFARFDEIASMTF